MIVEINSRADLQRELSPEIKGVKINLPDITAKDIVTFVLKYENQADVWIKINNFHSLPKTKWLIFKKRFKESCGQEKDYPLKRETDLFLTAFFFIISLPLFFIVSILVKLSSNGPVIFHHPRLDNNRRAFNLYKFRTMNHSGNSDEFQRNYMKRTIKGENSGQKVYKLIDDPRITPVGKWLRRLSIDEIPQLINVLKGEMSIVGPRPPTPYEVKIYEDWQLARLRAKPGMTGLWQVMGRSFIPFDEMVVLDLYYASTQSLWLDLKILLHTIPVVLSSKGAF